MTPEQEARAAAERDPSPRYDDGRPKMHRHFAEFAVHLDEECDRPSTRRRVYLFDTDELEAHEAWIAERAEAALADTYAAVQDALTQSADEDEMREALTVILTGTPRGGATTTVEIGGQVMTQAQFDAARYPLLHPNPGPTLRGGPYPYEASRG